MEELLQMHYGFLFSDELLREFHTVGQYAEFTTGDEIIDYGQEFEYVPLLLSGAIRIMREDENGNELLLYFLERGDTCASTLNSGFARRKSEIRAEAETDVKLILIPIEKLDEWMCEYDEWRKFILESFYSKINELLDVVDSMAFHQLDERVLQFLKDKAIVSGDLVLKVTHQEIARDLNSSRVVISRLLKKLENKGIIKISRNQIELLEF